MTDLHCIDVTTHLSNVTITNQDVSVEVLCCAFLLSFCLRRLFKRPMPEETAASCASDASILTKFIVLNVSFCMT